VSLSAGTLDRRVTFQKAAETQSQSGAVVLTWGSVATVWASFTPESGTESFREGQEQAWGIVRFRTRYWLDDFEGPTPKYRISHDGRLYDILEVREIGRREGWEFVARARQEDPTS
jgi:SPP1 family predicted phage head-tail adaptor